jgi:hypothetical protein
MRSDAAPALSQAIAPTWTGTHNWAPTSGTVTQAVAMNGTLPSSGSSSTTFNLGEVNLVNPGYTVTPGSVLDAFGGYQSTNAFRATYSANGGSTINSAIWGAAKQTASTSNLTGVIGSSYSNITATGDGIWGMIGFVNIGPSGNVGASIMVAAESIAGTGAVMGARAGVAAVSETNIKGTNIDAAFAVVQGPAPGTTNYTTSGPWKNGFVLSRILYGNQGPPLTTDGKVLFADTAFTTQDFADMSAVTFTGKLFNLSNFAMDASGYTIIGGAATAPPAGDTRLLVTGSSRGTVETVVAQNTTTGGDGFQISASTGAIQSFVGVAEPGNTTSRFGVTLGGYAQLISYSSSNGLLLGSVTAKPVILGANNVEIVRLTSGGGVTVPSTVTGGDKGAGTLNAGGLYDSGNRVLTTASGGQLPATATNDNASAGNVGEYIESVVTSGSSVSITTATAKTVTSISLTAGDWDVDALGYFGSTGTTSFTAITVSISGTTNTLDATPGKINTLVMNATTPAGISLSQVVPPYRLSLSGTTTVYLVVQATFTVSTATGFGIVRARRIR